jgi:hypothetical protein
VIKIPDEVVEAAARADYEAWREREDLFDATLPWDDAEEHMRVEDRIRARITIAAAINAWQGMEMRPTFNPSRIILPLPQEKE